MSQGTAVISTSTDGQGQGQSQRVTYFRGLVQQVLAVCKEFTSASRKAETREYRVAELRRLLLEHKVAVYVLELVLAEEARHEMKDTARSTHEDGDDSVVVLPAEVLAGLKINE
jgi:hypothetical protein